MAELKGFDKKAFYTHIDELPWKEVSPGFRVKEMLCEKTWGKSEYYFGYAELDPGASIPPQSRRKTAPMRKIFPA